MGTLDYVTNTAGLGLSKYVRISESTPVSGVRIAGRQRIWTVKRGSSINRFSLQSFYRNMLILFQVEQSAARISELEDTIEEIRKENQKLQDLSGKAIEKEKRAKGSNFCSYSKILLIFKTLQNILTFVTFQLDVIHK